MEGIVLKTIEYKEKSKLVYLYTPVGMMSVKALDATKTKLGFITTLNQVDFEISKGKLPTVLEYSLKKSFYSMDLSMEKVGTLAPILDVIQHLEEDANHKRIYPFFLQTLSALEQSRNPQYVLSAFLVKMLAVFGIKPQLKECVLCGEKDLVNFSILKGGALCKNCSDANEEGYEILNVLTYLYYQKEYEEAPKEFCYHKVLEAIYNYYTVHANFNLKPYTL